MLFPVFLFILEEDLLPHHLRWKNKDEGSFLIRYLNINNPKSNLAYLALFSILDGADEAQFLDSVKDDKFDRNSKVRCKGNIKKFMDRKSPYFSFIRKYKDLGVIKEFKLRFEASEIPSFLSKLSEDEKERIRAVARCAINNLKDGEKIEPLPNPTFHYLCLSEETLDNSESSRIISSTNEACVPGSSESNNASVLRYLPEIENQSSCNPCTMGYVPDNGTYTIYNIPKNWQIFICPPASENGPEVSCMDTSQEVPVPNITSDFTNTERTSGFSENPSSPLSESLHQNEAEDLNIDCDEAYRIMDDFESLFSTDGGLLGDNETSFNLNNLMDL